MASLRQAVKDFQDELRDGMAWVIFWREGRSWQSDYLYLELGSDTIPYDDIGKLQQIAKLDPRAVALNGYYCGHLAEDMSIDELANGVRWHYENGFNSLAGFIEQHDGTIPPEQIEEARQIAHAAGLPFSERPYDGQDINPYIYDGSMTPEDYELMQKRITAERSDRMDEEKRMNYLEAYLSNLGKHAEGQPMGEWVQFPTTPEHLKEVFDRIGIDGKQYREWQITEYHSDLSGLVKHLGERESLDELNYLGKLLEMQFDGDREKFVAAVAHGEYAGSVKDLINLAQNLDCYWLYPTVQSEEDYGRYLIDELDELELPEEAKKYFMYEDYGRDAVIKDKGRFTEQGYIYNNQNTFTEWYDGRDIPQEYRVTPEFPQPERGDPEKADMDAAAIGGAQTAAPDAPRPVIPIILSSTDKKERVKEITGHLELGIQDVFESDRYKNYLTTLSKHHTYSFNNTMLIAMQGGHFVKGYSQWQKEFGRHVMENQKSIKILAPAPYKVKRHVQKIDPETNAPLLDKDGKPVMEEKEIIIPDYKVVSVFDVSQTEGKEMPPLTLTRPLIGDVEQYEDFFAAIEKASPFPIGFEQLDGGGRGVCLYDERRIAINEGMSQLQNVKTAIHETAHAKLHDIGSDILSENTGRPDKRTREVQAESIAYAVCQYFGLDTSDYSFAYLAEWSSGKELTELKSSLETIQQTAKELITEIEGHFLELQQSREVAAPQRDEATPEIAQEAASAGMTVEEYAANGYEQHAPAPEATQNTADEPQTTLFDKLPPEQQQALSDTVKDTLQTLIDADKRVYGDVTGKTLEAIAAQGFTYRDGQLEKQQPEPQQGEVAAEQPETQPTEAGSPATPYYSINEAAARRANDMNSFRDYKPGSATAAYRQAVDEAAAIAKRQKERVDPMYHDKIDSLLDTYARKLAENMNKSYAIEGRVASILVAGGSNFPVAKKHKQNAARDKNMEEWRDIQGLLDKIRSTGMGGISADDPQAIPKLEKKLAGLEKAQETMKAVNAYYRKHKTLDGCPHLTPEQIEQAKAQMSNGWRVEDKPYPTWALSNNNAEIRRVKERIASLTKKNDTPFVGWEFDGGKVEANKADNRLQIFFDDKPDADTRAELKSGGFRWSPNAGAWQRQLNSNAYYAANGISAIQPLTGEKPTDLQRAYVREQQAQPEATPDSLMTGETIRTPRGNFYITDMSREQMEAAGYGFHHASDDGKYLIMGNGTRAFAIAAEQPQRDNPLKTVEQTVEQNDNMIDGIINNTPGAPTVTDLEQRAKAGEAISVTDLAKAVQAEKREQPQKKPSILKKLDEYKKQAAQQPQKQQKEQKKDLEV